MSRTRRASALTALCAITLVGGLTGCGDGNGDGDKPGGGLADKSAQEISDEAKKALLDAKSLRMKMSGTETAGDEPQSFDFAVDREGNCTGTFTGPQKQGSFELVKRGDEAWIKPDDAMWKALAPGKAGDAAARTYKGRHLYGRTTHPMFKELVKACDLTAIQKEIDADKSKGKQLRKGEVTQVGGKDAIELRQKSDEGKDETMYVATEGKPYPLKVQLKDGGAEQTTTFTDYDEPVAPETPSKADSVDITKLERLGQGA
ncbi:hypothetical protein ACFQVC_40255 [Streptomyces monticola]|uniref:Lipoprotein n=1 Tax=Streptomyces monticola TaxID=2666263 RepID=A0ABW2JY42_9ACTN